MTARDNGSDMTEIAEPQRITPTNRLADKIKLRKLYVRGHGSLESLCALHNVPYGTAVEWFQEEKWAKLKADYDALELAKLTAPEAEHPKNTPAPSETEQQLVMVNQAINSCADTRDWERLTRSKVALLECLSIERTGGKLGTTRVKPAKRHAEPTAEPLPSEPEAPLS